MGKFERHPARTSRLIYPLPSLETDGASWRLQLKQQTMLLFERHLKCCLDRGQVLDHLSASLSAWGCLPLTWASSSRMRSWTTGKRQVAALPGSTVSERHKDTEHHLSRLCQTAGWQKAVDKVMVFLPQTSGLVHGVAFEFSLQRCQA